jgi:serine/threonine-protein kinase RsbW
MNGNTGAVHETPRYLLHLEADKKQLSLLEDFVGQHALALRLSQNVLYDMLVAITEIVTNSIVHGYAGRPGAIDVEIWASGEALYARISDQAPVFDPTSVPAPDTSLPLEKRPPGGMGIHVTRRFVDEMTHQAPPQGGNELTLVRYHAVDLGAVGSG